MGVESPGPVKVLFPSIGEFQGQEVRWGRVVSKGSGEGIGSFWRGNQERGITFLNVNIENI
jgi:hypothetical protein